jgi:hypothetical protein
MAVVSHKWSRFFNPDSAGMFPHGSDVDWFLGSYVSGLSEAGAVRREHPWLVANRNMALYMVRHEGGTVIRLVAALMAWRTATVSQLQAGLCSVRVPDFTRDEPNLYGALNRLGVIDVGFNQSERLDGRRFPQVWVALGTNADLVRKVVDYVGDDFTGDDRWLARVMFSGSGFRMRRHARHNTFACHVALSALHDVSGVRFVTGDGWGSFRRIDERAAVDAGMTNGLNATDVVLSMGCNNVLAGVEVQAYSDSVTLGRKAERWARLLSCSPMSRRGLVCVWLAIPSAVRDWTAPFERVFERLRSDPVVAAGEPSVGSRIGLAYWTDWYEGGVPTGEWGTFVDVFGKRHSLFDDWWSSYTPDHVNSIDRISEWGWDETRRILSESWGMDASGWDLPDCLKGGFYGFSTPGEVKEVSGDAEG